MHVVPGDRLGCQPMGYGRFGQVKDDEQQKSKQQLAK